MLSSGQKTNQVPGTNREIIEKQIKYLQHCINPSFIDIINTVYNIGALNKQKKKKGWLEAMSLKIEYSRTL